MTNIESKIITLINDNQYLSKELKAKYILSLFLMDREEQEEYLKLIEAFSYRCHAAERGIYILRPDEKEKIMRTLDEVKEDILSKINSNQ